MDSRRLSEEVNEETPILSTHLITDTPELEVPALQVQLSKIAEFALIYGASYTADLCILHHAPADMQHVLAYCRDNYIGLEPMIGAATVSTYKALDYIKTVNLPLAVLNIANRLAWDVVYAEATGAIYTALNHCLLGREVSQPERAVWNVFGPALLRDVKDKVVKGLKYHSLFGHVQRHDGGGLADHSVTVRAYAEKELQLAQQRYTGVAGSSASSQPLMVEADLTGGSSSTPSRRNFG
jgi:hypothetical protein